MDTLLLSGNEWLDLKKRLLADDIGRVLYYEFISKTEWVYNQPIPSCPDLGPPGVLKNGPYKFGESPYSEEYLLIHESFDELTPAFEAAMLLFGAAYRFTGECRYINRLTEWLDIYLHEWDAWGPIAHPFDQFAVRILYGMTLAANTAGEDLPAELYDNLKKLTRQWYDRALKAFDFPNRLHNISIDQLGNHSWFNTSMIGSTALFLDDFYIAGLCKSVIESLFDWAVGEDGDYLDKPNYIMYAVKYAEQFLYLYSRYSKEKLHIPKLERIALSLIDLSPGSAVRPPMLLAAALFKNPVIQNYALSVYSHHELAIPWFLPTDYFWSCLFYDQNVVPANVAETHSGIRHYRGTGYVAAGSFINESKPKLILYAGPHSGKSEFDQGTVELHYFGEQLIGKPIMKNIGYLNAHSRVAHYSSNLNETVAYIDGLGQTGGSYPYEWPVNHVTKHEVVPPVGKIIRAEEGEGFYLAEADITKAYSNPKYEFMFWGYHCEPSPEQAAKDGNRVGKYIRTAYLVNDCWLIVRDSINLTKPGLAVDINFVSNGEINITGKTVTARVGRAAYDFYLLNPSNAELSAHKCVYSDRGRMLRIHTEPERCENKYIFAFHLRYYKNPPKKAVYENDQIYLEGFGNFNLK